MTLSDLVFDLAFACAVVGAIFALGYCFMLGAMLALRHVGVRKLPLHLTMEPFTLRSTGTMLQQPVEPGQCIACLVPPIMGGDPNRAHTCGKERA